MSFFGAGEEAPPQRKLNQAESKKYDSKLKYVLYGGGEDRPETPEHGHGRKSVPQASKISTAPFATQPEQQAGYHHEDQQQQGQSAVLNLRAKKNKEVTGKPQAPFDPEVYKAQRVANAQNTEASKNKNWGSVPGSGGIFGSTN